MKLKTWMAALVLAFAAVARGATNDLTGLLQKGLFEEEANRDLSAAIANYQSLASAFDQDRQLAATAIFRLGECYRKLGRTNDAVVQYQRVIKEFSDQATLATLSRQNLAGLNAAPKADENGTSAAALLDARADAASLQAQLQEIEKMSHDEKRVFVQQNYPNSVLTEAMTQLVNAEQDLIKLKTDYTPDHPKYQTAKALVDDLNARIDAQTDGVVHGLRDKLAAAQAKLNILRSGQNELTTGEGRMQESASTDEEQQQIRNIQAMIQNSPDLINAAGIGGRTPLMLAAEKGQLIVANYLLEHGADVNGGVRGSVTPLYLAADNGHKAMVELLLARGADVNGAQSANALYSAVSKGFMEVVEVLLANKADVNARGVLHAAVSGGRTNLIQLLIDHGADVNAADDNGNSPLHIAASENKPDAARILIASKADVNAIDKDSNTPLHDAAAAGNAKIVSLLLESGANVDATNHMNLTPLSVAVAFGRVDAVRALLEHKVDPNHSSPTPSSWPSHSYSLPSQPLIYAAIAGGRNEILKLLLDAGANAEGSFEVGASPLLYAINYNNVDAVQLLLQHGANPNGPSRSANESPLNVALDSGKDTRIVQLLLDKGADPNARNHDGLVALMRTSDPEVARWLIEHKADVNARTAGGSTPLMWATRTAEGSLKVLLTNGAKPDLQDTNGNTALHYAVHNSNTNAIALLLESKAIPNIQNNVGFTPLDLAREGSTGVIPWAMWNPGGANGLGVSSEAEKQITYMLVKSGGLANLPKRDRIEVRRGSSYDSTAIVKGPHDWNHFNLLETIAGAYSLLGQNSSGEWPAKTDLRQNLFNFDLRFPDFKKVVIYRRTANSAKQTAMNVDVEDILNTGDCSRDVWLEWGDIVEIPEADHPVDQHWPGLSDPDTTSLIKCVSRQVILIVKGESTTLKLAPELADRKSYPGDQMSRLLRASFMLRSVLDNSKLIRVSSDLSRVKVTRHDPVTKKTVEWVLDCASPDQADLWLRDGDVIEVPEK